MLASAWARSLSTIRGRLVLSFILIALVAIGIVGGVSGVLVKHFVERRETFIVGRESGLINP